MEVQLTSPNDDRQPHNTEVLDPINYARALEIAQAHLRTPESGHVCAWYDVKTQDKFDTEALKELFDADEVTLTCAGFTRGTGVISRFFERELHSIRVKNPKKIVPEISFRKDKYPLTSFQVYDLGNIPYAGVLFDVMHAVVRSEYFEELEVQGFTYSVATEPGQPIHTGPFRNVHSVDEILGPGGSEWLDATLRGEESE